MAIQPNPLLAAIVSAGGLALGVGLFRWVIAGLLRGELQYRFHRYDRRSRPILFWCVVIWGLGVGVCFSLGGLATLYLFVMKALL